ncbi:MAG: TIGR03088 family PEP-CTERM/XrtA system glycosyltransferase [Halioglobus sp.]|nr:TIGR03088 family PEP-CTERM/XrtA system glycosyltransferase [Halioglobus sp.]
MSAPPLVAHVIYALSTGGLENGLVNIINRFPAGRYRHVIICITNADEFSRRISAADVQVIELHKPSGHSLGFYVRLWRLFRELKPQIIHSRNLAALETQVCSIGLRGVRRVHGEHGREVGDLDGRNRKYLLLRRAMRIFIHRYIAVSKDIERWLVTLVGVRESRVTQIYNGVDHERFRSRDVRPTALLPQSWQGLDDILVVGTVGRLTPVKDQQLLLRAAHALCAAEPELARRLRVVIVGDGPLRAELEKLVVELGLESTVWLAGDREDVPDLLQLMQVFVLPSLGEGISNTVLEAMASGLPVVATAVGGNVELVEDGVNGALVPVGDVAALAASLRELLCHEADRRRRARNAQRFVQSRFDWSKTVAQYLQVYDGLLGLKTGAPMETAG